MYTFPTNLLGLQRGTILEATHPAVAQLGLNVGDRIPIGFDGTYVRCQGFTWSIDQLVNEIQSGVWKVVGLADLSDPIKSELFSKEIESGENDILGQIMSEFGFAEDEEKVSLFLALVTTCCLGDERLIEPMFSRAAEIIPEEVLISAIRRLDELKNPLPPFSSLSPCFSDPKTEG